MRQLKDALADDLELFGGLEAIDRAGPDPCCHLILERRHPDLKELVEQLGEDRHELDSFEERELKVFGEIEEPGTKVETRELSVREALSPKGDHGSEIIIRAALDRLCVVRLVLRHHPSLHRDRSASHATGGDTLASWWTNRRTLVQRREVGASLALSAFQSLDGALSSACCSWSG